jgi:hypothetical protein
MTAPAPSSRSPESYQRLASPVLRSAWLLRASAVLLIVATVLAVIVVPGVRGHASDNVVIVWERIAAVTSIAAAVLVSGLVMIGSLDLWQATKIGAAPRSIMIALSAVVFGVALAASLMHLPSMASVPMMVASGALAMIAASGGARAPHTRAPSLLLLGMGAAAIMRLFAWELALGGSDRPGMFTAGRVFATIAIVLVGLSQMVCAAWMSARGRGVGQVATIVALLCAFGLVWGAAKGGAVDAPTWQAVLHTALKDQPSPQAFGVDALPAFLTLSSMTLALATLLVRGQIAVITCTLSLGLLGRGSLDVPMCALATAASALWLALAASDERAMWQDLVVTRDEKKAAD